MEEVKKNVLSIDEIKKEILNAKLSDNMDKIENYDVIKKLFEDNYDIIITTCQDGENINFTGFAESFLPENEPGTWPKIDILNQLFNEVAESKTQPQQEPLNAPAEGAEEQATEEKSEQEENTSAQVQQLQEQNELANAGKPTEQEQQTLQQQDVLVEKVAEQLEPQQLNFKGLIEAKNKQNQALVSCIFELDQENQILQTENLKLNIQCKNQQLMFKKIAKNIKEQTAEMQNNTVVINECRARLIKRRQQFQALNEKVKNSESFVYLDADNMQYEDMQNILATIDQDDNKNIVELKRTLVSSENAIRNFDRLNISGLKMLK